MKRTAKKRTSTARMMLRVLLAATLASVPSGVLADPSESESRKRPFTTDFAIEDCTFVNDDTGLSGNPLFIPLIPGNQVTLEEDEGALVLQITVCDGTPATCDGLPGTEAVFGVTTRVIEEREHEEGELVEVSRNFFARCEENNAIFYFGEDVDIYEDGVVVSHEGAWRAGVDDALPGVIMPGLFLLGARYLQEMAPGVALDRAENAEMGLDVDVPYGLFTDCVRVFETSELSASDRSVKEYCPGVGLVVDDEAELVDKNF